MRKLECIVLFCLVASFSVNAGIKLPSVISSNMVLQQKSNVPLWGYASPNAEVFIATSWNNRQYKITANGQGQWRQTVSTPSAGGPYSIFFKEGNSIEVTNILIGEVWFCGGQSNMERLMKGRPGQPIKNSAALIASSKNPNIRLFAVKAKNSKIPMTDCEGIWAEADTGVVANFSALGYQFARILQQNLNIPVGILLSCRGGSAVEEWMDENTIQMFSSGFPSKSQLFNGMINPLLGFGVKGFLFYQGESNKQNPEQYLQLFPAMVKNWRSLWGRGNLPFYYVQIAPFEYNDDKKLNQENAAKVRESQLKSLDLIPNSAMVVLLDIGEKHGLHPADKTTIAERLVNIALARDYGKKGLVFSGPVFKSMSQKGPVIELKFKYAFKGLTDKGRGLNNFEIAGADRRFFQANAKIVKNRVVVGNPKVVSPVAVRYGYKNWVMGDLFNSEGLPASSFRTDNWKDNIHVKPSDPSKEGTKGSGGKNIAIDGGMDQWATETKSINWNIASIGVSRDADRSGNPRSFSAKITPVNGKTGQIASIMSNKVVAGKTYKISFWYKTQDAQGAGGEVSFRNQSIVEKRMIDFPAVQPTEWNRFEMTTVAPAGAPSISFIFKAIYRSGGGNDSVWYDDIELVQMD
ncbi:MAG: hypothetical protein M0Q53_01715 [Prolixibacteraceae bacterium]|jgi:sialate O-acetylesterase|nr:hypothetical protein [Prolixibacteraceae bacterium]